MNNDYQNFEFELIRFSSMTSPISKEEFNKLSEEELTDKLYPIVSDHYKNDTERHAHNAFPVIKNVFETEGDRYERIVVPFTDGVKTLQVVTNLKEAYESEGRSLVNDFEKNITLSIIDENWKDHLRKMDELKQTVQNATYEQKDPLLVYKFEAFELFQATVDKVNKEVLSFLFKGQLPSQDASQVSEATEQKREVLDTRKDEVQNSISTSNEIALVINKLKNNKLLKQLFVNNQKLDVTKKLLLKM